MAHLDTRDIATPGPGSQDWPFLCKRCFDLTLAAALLFLSAPIFIIAALLVRISSRGPIFFAQERCGFRGQTFRMLKFRTMVIDQGTVITPDLASSLAASGVLLKLKRDPRVTSVGRLLRRLSIDELPQLVNVVRGEMSLVGPRPLIPFMLTAVPEHVSERSSVRPGITGLWQVRAREKNTSVLDMIEFDLKYIREFNLRLDLLILSATVRAVITGHGAH